MKTGQILITDENYTIYINTSKKEFLLDIIHTELCKTNLYPEVLCVNIVKALCENNYVEGSITISPFYNIYCDLFIIVDFSNRTVTIDGSTTDEHGFIQNYDKKKMSFSEFIHSFYTDAHL